MSLTVSIFDLFAYAIPGSLYMALLVYISDRLGWLHFEALKGLNTTFLLVGAALASYLLGHLTYRLGGFVNRMLPGSKTWLSDGKQVFLEYASGPKAQSLVQIDPFLLLAAAEIRAREAAVEISRFRAGALMLRSSVPPFILAFLVSIVEFVGGQNRPLAACSSVLFLLASFAALQHGREQATWAISKTYQVAYWMTEFDNTREAGRPADRTTRGDQ